MNPFYPDPFAGVDRGRIEDLIIEEALRDPSFCRILRADPGRLLEARIRKPLQEGIEYLLVEEDPGTFYLVRRNGARHEEVLSYIGWEDEALELILTGTLREVVLRELGLGTNEELRIKVLQETESRYYLVLPYREQEG